MINNKETLKGLQTGTTTLGMVFNEGVILASESRVSAGYYVASKTGEKVLKIDDHIGMTIAGSVADAQAMVDQARALVKLYFFIIVSHSFPKSKYIRLLALPIVLYESGPAFVQSSMPLTTVGRYLPSTIVSLSILCISYKIVFFYSEVLKS